MPGYRAAIKSIKMANGETIYDYHSRFMKLIARCPQHGISEEDLINSFMNGMRQAENDWIDAACGWNVINKPPSEIFRLFAEMADRKRNQQETLEPSHIGQSSGEDKFDKILKAIEAMAGKARTTTDNHENAPQMLKRGVKMCGVCSATNHATDQCPTWFEDEEVNAIGQQPYQQGDNGQRRFNNNNNWKPHDNLRYGGNHYQQAPQFLGQQNNQAYVPNHNPGQQNQQLNIPTQQGHQNQPYVPPHNRDQPRPNSLRTEVEQIAAEQMKGYQELDSFRMETRGGITNINGTLNHLVETITKMKELLSGSKGELPPQVEIKKAHVNVVTLRSGIEVPETKEQKEYRMKRSNQGRHVDQEVEPEQIEEAPWGSADEEEM